MSPATGIKILLAVMALQLGINIGLMAGIVARLAGAAMSTAVGSGSVAFFAAIAATIGVIAFIRSD